MAKKRIPVSSVTIGMYLCEIDRSWLKTPFLRHRFLLHSEEDIIKLREAGIQEITIDTDRGLDVVSTEKPTSPQTDHSPLSENLPKITSPDIELIQNLPEETRGKSLGGELTKISHSREEMLQEVQKILETFSKTGGLAVEQVNQITQSIMTDTLDHEEAYIALITTREFSPALYDHALSVSTLSVLLGRAVGLNDTECQDLAIAGLLHDAGLTRIPETLHKPLNELSKTELGIYQAHPHSGLDFLMTQSTLSEQVQTYIREHHVALDGSGYPADIDPSTVQQASRILRLVDEYDELLSGHKNGKPLTVRKAMQTLFQLGKKGALDEKLVSTFINLIGIYPTYSFVELSTGERGIVTANSQENLLHPTILLIQDASHKPFAEPIPFNFSGLDRESVGPEIVRILPPEEVDIQLDTVLENWVTL